MIFSFEDAIELLLVIFFFASVGSFLNVLAYRLVHDKSFFAVRSSCPDCQTIIPWYYNIPLISFFWLRGQSSCCQKKISWLYPLIELLSTLVFTLHFFCITFYSSYTSMIYYLPLSCLLVAIRTDLEEMVILTPLSLWIAPLGLIAAFFGWLPITVYESLLGAIGGYVLLYIINYIAIKIRGERGIGEGDMDLIALIGAFWGIQFLPYILWGASIIGLGMSLFFIKKNQDLLVIRVPFGPSLAISIFLIHLYSFM